MLKIGALRGPASGTRLARPTAPSAHAPLLREHNHLPLVNMRDGFPKTDWPDDVILAE